MSIDRPPRAISSTRRSGSSQLDPIIPPLERFISRLPKESVIPLSGAIAGAVAGVVSCPLDVIKTKLQAQGGFQGAREGLKASSIAYKGVAGSASTIWKEDGLRGMYRGLGPMLLGYVPTWAVYLTVYNKSQAFFRTTTGECASSSLSFAQLITVPDNWFVANVYASLTAGACSTMATNPIWVIKTRLMSQSSSRSDLQHSKAPWHYRNTWDAARKMYFHEGFMSFYSGLTPALLGVAHVAIQFPLYEVFKEKFTGLGKGVAETDEDRSHHFYGLALAVFLSKVCASTATYPHEVVRTRLQTQQRATSFSPSRPQSVPSNGHMSPRQISDPNVSRSTGAALRYKGTWQTCKAIYVEEGWRGFYAGLGTNLIRAVPSAMTTILTFEFLKKTFLDMQKEDDFEEGQASSAR